MRHLWRDVLLMAAIGVALLAVVLPPLVRRAARARAATEAARQQLVEAAAFADALIDGMDAGLATLDARTDVLTLNQVARRMHGVPDADDVESFRDAIRDGLCDPATGQPLPYEQRPLARALAGESCEMRAEIHSLDGAAPLQVLIRARPIRDAEGTVIAGASVMHDITHQLARERALADHAAHIATLASATRAVLREDDARLAVCDAARSVSGAALVSLFEPDDKGFLVCTAAIGLELVGMRMPLGGRSQVATSFNAAKTVVVPDVATEPDTDRDTVARLESMLGAEIGTAVYTPVVVSGTSIAVLITTFVVGAGDAASSVPMLEVLANEAGVAIEREDLLRRLREQAVTDPLTGLGNRRAWLDGLARETARAGRTRDPLGVAMIDLDHFKRFNDTWGHPEGDELLTDLARAWSERLRGGDLICRVGGEEFALLLPGCPPGALEELVEALRALVPRGQTASAGTTHWAPGEDPMTTVSRADSLLYKAKQTGRDRQVYEPAPETSRRHVEGPFLRVVDR